MSRIGAAVAIEMNIPKSRLVRVLVVDDEPAFQEDMRGYFEALECYVDIASSIKQAEHLLRERQYEIILADVNFKGILPEGDLFVLQNYKNFNGARVIVVTGLDSNKLRSRNKLEKLGVPIWDKGDPEWGPNLRVLTQSTVRARKEEIAGRINEFLGATLGDPGTNYISDRVDRVRAEEVSEGPRPWEAAVEEILLDWLNSQVDKEEPFFSLGRDVLSANRMIDEIKTKSAYGEELLQMFVVEIRACVGVGGS